MNRDRTYRYIPAVAAGATVSGVLAALLPSQSSDKLDSLRVLLLIAGTALAATGALATLYLIKIRQDRLKRRQVALIFAEEDRPVASRIVSMLDQLGYSSTFPFHDILPGQSWKATVNARIQQSGCSIVLISRNNTSSSIFERDLFAAILSRTGRDPVPLIPAILDGSDLPVSLKDIQAADLSSPIGYEILLRGVRAIFESSEARGWF